MTWKKRWNFGWKLTKLHTTSTHLQMPRQKEIGRMRWHAHTAPLRSSRRSQRHHTNFLLDIPQSNIFSVLFIYNFNHSVFLGILKNIIFCLWYFTGWVFCFGFGCCFGENWFWRWKHGASGFEIKITGVSVNCTVVCVIPPVTHAIFRLYMCVVDSPGRRHEFIHFIVATFMIFGYYNVGYFYTHELPLFFYCSAFSIFVYYLFTFIQTILIMLSW